MRRALTLLAALALGAAPLSAHATTAPTLTLTQQARKADVIVRATLGTPTNVTEGEATWITYPLTVTETVAGDPATLPQREGRPVLYVLSGLEDLPELRAGQEAFLLLYSRRMDNPIVGFAQGVYPIVNGRVTRPGEAAGTTAGTGASTGSGTTTPSGSAATPTTTGAATSTTSGTAISGTGTATAPTPPGSTTSTAAPGSGATTTAPGTATSGTATATAPGTTPPATTTSAGATSSTAGGTTTPSTATGTTPSATASAPGATTPNSTAGSTPTTTPASGTTSPAATTPPVNEPNAIPSDPARFRDALRAAREAR
ncbi:hypothetical protein [Deinococcus planocerae]|uniref:hypothetical protein n=1 Tax=Deinococcus planocerae TaxID=1737569 RepID=UPI000C7F29F2|nr:hypothetical protein [Deinococcus planocerae]